MAALIIFGLVALAVAVAVLYVVAHAVNKIVRFLRHFTLLWRFLAGHPLDGVHRTNATFWRAPTKALHPTADKSGGTGAPAITAQASASGPSRPCWPSAPD